MKKIIFSLLASLFLLQAQEFKILTEEAPPFNYLEDGKIKGWSTEIVREILKRVGHPDNIKLISWTKGYNATLNSSGYALYGTARNAEREKLFKWVGPITEFECVLYARKDFDKKIATLEDAKKVSAIGVYKDDFQEQLLKKEGFENLQSTINNSLNPIKLASGEIELWANGNASAVEEIKKTKIARGEFKVVYKFCKNDLYIAFSKDTDDTIIAKWQKALDSMKADGTHAKITEKYK